MKRQNINRKFNQNQENDLKVEYRSVYRIIIRVGLYKNKSYFP